MLPAVYFGDGVCNQAHKLAHQRAHDADIQRVHPSLCTILQQAFQGHFKDVVAIPIQILELPSLEYGP